ncbi:hypothetical protein GGX14DRAFT_580690 [Mycena pura]|uniref:Uncharacterized protein n=1 Tax=Mycena pura TaxID=153505 RepID=A0AAD6XZ51_9AGAR|nr:hypothetical protein GGX14DRAFT_580690 [Mycena pura]
MFTQADTARIPHAGRRVFESEAQIFQVRLVKSSRGCQWAAGFDTTWLMYFVSTLLLPALARDRPARCRRSLADALPPAVLEHAPGDPMKAFVDCTVWEWCCLYSSRESLLLDGSTSVRFRARLRAW